ncbi:MAG: hypothetical protein BMS9Abin05_2428 [Rhodothermia bacterium]|nr:MAG: hypothetical protein BMS9Abin05_2428 [Rhodothermia bacterium]
MEEEFVLVESPLKRAVEIEGHTLSVEIYSTGKDDWILEVVNEEGTSTVWDGTFDTDRFALAEFQKCLEEEGLTAFL